MAPFEVREAALPADLADIERLWLEYLAWGNDEMAARHGFRVHATVRDAVAHDLAEIRQFQPPDGRLVVVEAGGRIIGCGGLRRIGPEAGEIKRMYVEPAGRGFGAGQAIVDALIAGATDAGYRRVQLDSPDFMLAAHGLYRSRGFEPIDPYPESEVPAELHGYWLFLGRTLE